MRHIPHCSFLLLILTCAILPAQQTWKVNCNGGPEVHFTDVPQAVAAASVGDTILFYHDLAAGCPGALGGVGYTAPTIVQGCNLVGFTLYTQPSAPGSLPTFGLLYGTLRITGIPAGERVTVSTIGVIAENSTTTGGFVISNCQGQVILDEVNVGGSAYANTVLEINNCADVTLRGCQFLLGGAQLRIVDSDVRMSWTVFGAVIPPASTGGYPVQPPAAIELINSTLTITGSTINGPREWPNVGMLSKPGVVLTNSTLFIGPGTILRGGLVSGSYGFPHLKVTSAPSYVYRDPKTQLAGSIGTPTPVMQDMSATYIRWAIANDMMRTHVLGPIDGFALVMLSDLTYTPVSTPYGMLLIDPATVMFVDILPLPASNGGTATVDYFVPSSAPNGHAFVMQSLTLSPSGQLGLSLPVPFTVAWEHGRLP